jgi:hypothetical protein
MLTHNTLGRNGRLGNQMFQYASTKGIAVNGGHDYQIPSSGHSLFEAFELHGIEDHINPIQGLQTFNERFFHFDQDFFSEQVDDRDLFGYFQTEKYFKHIEQSIRKDFKFKDSIVENVSPIMQSLIGMKVFSIHFRRTDYLQYADAHPVPSYEYYAEAIEKFDSYDLGFVFSDDIEWCMNLDLLNTGKFIFSNNSNYEDMYLMSQCDGHILANSSFSWWGAWLNNNPNKRVTVPQIWFGPKLSNDTKDLIPLDWNVI